MNPLLVYSLIKTARRLTFDIIEQDELVTYNGDDDGPYFKFVASNGYEVISRSRMDIQTERIWLLGAKRHEDTRSGTMVFSDDAKRDAAYDNFVQALSEWAAANDGFVKLVPPHSCVYLAVPMVPGDTLGPQDAVCATCGQSPRLLGAFQDDGFRSMTHDFASGPGGDGWINTAAMDDEARALSAGRPSQATPAPAPTTRAEAEESDWRTRLTVNLLRQGAGLTKRQIRALIDHAVDGIEPDPALFPATPNLYIGACITDGRLHATVQRFESNGNVTLVATAEMDAASLHGHDCIAQMKQATPEPVGEVVYQIKGEAFECPHAWRDATEEAFYTTPAADRRIVYTRPAPGVPDGLQWFTVAEHGMPDFDEEVIGGLWYTDPWLKPERATRFMWGLCRVLKDDHRDFKDGKRWQTFGPSHNDITHWARLNMPALAAAQAKAG